MSSEVTSTASFLLLTSIFFVAIVLRYFLVAGIFHLHYYVVKPGAYRYRKLGKEVNNSQIRREILRSITSSIVFAVAGAGSFWLWQEGYTAIYLEADQYGHWYLPVSLIIAMLIHETYYYWVHRLMHHPGIFRVVHKAHHDSLSPTPWTAFSFHPWESLLEAIILPLILIIVPLHPAVIGFHLMIMTVSSVINHLGIEVYPVKFLEHPVGKLFIGATHHHLHHKEFRTNFGLYFTFWDKWMGTESKAGG
ncbi:sterol desaturase family protein [Fulvivirga imtechensis AK7]|uniref:Sterol desaturase family protein n=1 Tax=Fulvivirga imtechensis AK7 TaxID=1237149 RepID=L8JSX1_9BACT|nr:sterol desaturase family protein [Fulvivirga imtechensis]ELR70462.1 sterol desaturase family protein [Fulvivirga imtechensis AK7]